MESELRIARDIQMSMVPSVFPNVEGLDMYASMTPAKEVGGDLYNFLWKGDMLYFCIGDVSGKGVPASLFMTLATRGFLSLASTGKTPAEIATRLNVELSDNNEMGMFVTMFICMYDLKQGRVEYCNAGHNPPVIGNAEGQYAFLDVKEANAPIGLWPDLEYVGEEMDLPSGGIMLLYTDGLNEAENRQQEPKYARHHRGPQGRHRPVPRRRRAERRPHHARLPHHQQTIELFFKGFKLAEATVALRLLHSLPLIFRPANIQRIVVSDSSWYHLNYELWIMETHLARMQGCKVARFHLFFSHLPLPVFSTQPSLFQRLMMLYNALSVNSLPFSLRSSPNHGVGSSMLQTK